MPDRQAGIFSCALLATVLLAGSALAQKADRPDVKAGDRWQFVRYWETPLTTPNREWVINAVTARGIEGTENGEPLLLTLDLGILDSPSSGESNPKPLSFPLTVGKRWRYTSEWVFKAKGSRGKLAVEVEVVSQEKVAVVGGAFDAFKLVSKGSVSGTSPIGSQYDAVITTTYWYAPEARAIVKSVSHNPYLGTSTVDLVAYQLQR